MAKIEESLKKRIDELDVTQMSGMIENLFHHNFLSFGMQGVSTAYFLIEARNNINNSISNQTLISKYDLKFYDYAAQSEINVNKKYDIVKCFGFPLRKIEEFGVYIPPIAFKSETGEDFEDISHLFHPHYSAIRNFGHKGFNPDVTDETAQKVTSLLENRNWQISDFDNTEVVDTAILVAKQYWRAKTNLSSENLTRYIKNSTSEEYKTELKSIQEMIDGLKIFYDDILNETNTQK